VEQAVLPFQAPAFEDVENFPCIDVFKQRPLAHSELGRGLVDGEKSAHFGQFCVWGNGDTP
jgi:hypothetical protein